MRIPKHISAVVILTLLFILSGFAAISPLRGNLVNAPSALANATGTSSYGDLLQYEWPQYQGDAAFTRFSAGPAPNAPDIMWKTNITGIQSYISAFNGKVFVANSTTFFALDEKTGSIVWNTTLSTRWPVVYKIDDTHMVIGGSCLDPETGDILWTSDDFTANAAFFAASTYSPEEKTFYVKTSAVVQAWNFSAPSNPPTLAWETYVSGGASVGSGVQYGDGIVFPGSFEQHQMALDAKTGKVLWDVQTKSGMIFNGAYYQGKFIRGGPFDNTLYCFNATTGDILWTFNPGTSDGYWASGLAAAYGMVYGLSKDGHLYAIDVNTGKPVWVYEGPGPLFFPGNPIVADGKVYATTGQSASFNPATGEYSKSEFACLDAYTGQVIWKLPVEAYPPRESTAIAYGHLYLIPGFVKAQQMDEYVTFDQVWAIGTQAWPMWRHDPAHTAVGQSGPENLTLRWKFSASGAVVSSPSVADGRVYFGSRDKHVYCVDAETGAFIWDFNTTAGIVSSPAVVDGKVYIGPDDGTIYCLNAYNGSLIWSAYAGGYVEANFGAAVNLRSSPTVVGDKVYVGSLDKNVYSLDANTGDVQWTYQTKGCITSSPAVVEGVVYIISQEPDSGGLYMLNATNGDLIQRITLPYVLASRGTDLHSSPAVAEGMIFAASNKRAYYGINATTGNVTWTFSDPDAEEFIIASPIYHDGKVFLVDQFFIVAVDAFNGSLVWQVFVGTEFYVSPTYADGKLYVTSDQRGMYVLNATDGSKISWFATPSNSWSSPTLYEGKAYVGNNDWNVYCIAGYPQLNSSVTVELAKSEVILGESVVGCGYLVPGMPNASITLSFVKPDGAVVNVQVTTSENGFFDFTYTPNAIGNWAVTAAWQSDRGYYNSACSEKALLDVAPAPTPTLTPSPPMEWFGLPPAYVIIFVIVAIAVVILGFVYIRRNIRRKRSRKQPSGA
jgi:outer membrane protein assembly factor BamB